MQRAACQLGSRRGRPLRCSLPHSAAGAGGSPPPVAPDHLCRICWDVEGEDNGLVAPCACSGSMRYVHTRCLQHWQAQLRATKGTAAARRCDVCKACWAKGYQPAAGPTDWRNMLRDLFRAVPWPAVLECWKFSVLAIGAIQGVQAGIAGFRSGMEWAAGASRHNLEGLARWAPEMALAAGTMPPLKVPMALCLAAFVTGLAAQVALMSIVCAYAGSVAGFVSGVSGCLLATLHTGASLLRQGTLAASALASGAARGIAMAGSLAAPVVMALLKTLAFTRLFS